MPAPVTGSKQSILEPVLRMAGQRLEGAAATEAREFLALYYDQVDAEDLASRDARGSLRRGAWRTSRSPGASRPARRSCACTTRGPTSTAGRARTR